MARLVLAIALCLCLPAFLCDGAEKDANVPDQDIADKLRILEGVYPASLQVILVTRVEAAGADAQLSAFEMNDDDEWKPVLGPVPAMIGRNGFAQSGEKREGDGKTPSGIYYLGFTFGYSPKIDSTMPYRHMTRNDIWVDDPASPDYNRLKKCGETRAKSFEDMVLPDDRYKYGIVIRYNMDPVVPDHGSAIFLHVWKDPKTATSGCVAISEENMLRLLKWLDPGKNPVIMLGEP
jgi:L,D-peptidoglycan transpeptidase YkuD (ErfK/YbiS/YcfS/YnhG family)